MQGHALLVTKIKIEHLIVDVMQKNLTNFFNQKCLNDRNILQETEPP